MTSRASVPRDGEGQAPSTAQQAHASARAFAPLLGPHTAVLTAMNGIPSWNFHKQHGPLDGHHLESVDPGAAQWDAIEPERAIG